jgi:hypothetical protein
VRRPSNQRLWEAERRGQIYWEAEAVRCNEMSGKAELVGDNSGINESNKRPDEIVSEMW